MRAPLTTMQPLADKAAIGLSLLCAVHCLAMPLVVALLPSLAAMGLADEAFHTWMVFAVIPLSVFALTMGCRKHGSRTVLYIGGAGLFFLCLTPLLGHERLGEIGEKALTMIGTALIATAHIRNFQLCQKSTSCECPEG